jgi:hypothetical protein
MTDSPAALLDFIMLEMTGALLMQDMAMIPIPMPRAMRRERHGVVSHGRDSRQIPGDTFGEGSDDHAHWAMLLMRELLLIASIVKRRKRRGEWRRDERWQGLEK